MSGEGLPGGKTVVVDNRRERDIYVNKSVKQNEHKTAGGRRHSALQENGKRVTRLERISWQERSFS